MKKKTSSLVNKDSRYQLLPPSIGTKKRIQRLVDELNSPTGDLSVERIYKDVDHFYNDCIKPIAVCKQGCSHCCYVPVEVTQLEARYIEEKTKHKMIELSENKTRQPAHEPCPFLKDNQCSIYPYRPLACRMFATLDDVLYCEAGNVPHIIVTTSSSGMSEYLVGLFTYVSQDMDGATYADIREWFGDKLANK